MSALRAPAQPEPEGQWSLSTSFPGCPRSILLDAWEERKTAEPSGLPVLAGAEGWLVSCAAPGSVSAGDCKAQAQWFG